MGTVIQLQLAGGHYLLTGLQAFADHYLAFAALAGVDEAALDHQFGLAFGVFDHLVVFTLLLVNHVHRVAIQGVGDGGFRYDDQVLLAGLTSMARTCTLRVASSTLGLIAAISPSNTSSG